MSYSSPFSSSANLLRNPTPSRRKLAAGVRVRRSLRYFGLEDRGLFGNSVFAGNDQIAQDGIVERNVEDSSSRTS